MIERGFIPGALASCLIACSGTHGGNNLDVGSDDSGPPTTTFVTGDASGGAALDAYVAQNQVAVKVVTVTCSGGCATVQAVGTGGYPPYTYRWSDGTTTAARTVCPTSDASYSVAVTDTGVTGEISVLPQTVTTSVTADFIACPDGGSPGDVGDAGAATVYWARWTDGSTGALASATGVITPPSATIQVQYAGEVYGVQTSSGSNEYTPPATFLSATVADAPPGPSIVEVGGGTATTIDTITFSQPVVNPLMAIVSLGTGSLNTPATFYFQEPLVVLSSGTGPYGTGYWGDDALTESDGGLTGTEGNGVIEFQGTFTTLHWTDPTGSLWTGLTVGMRAP